MITPATPDDSPRVAALLSAVFDDRVITAAGMRYRRESAPTEDRVGYWLAEHAGEVVGWAVGGIDAFASVRTTAFAGIAVHPEHRARGIGSALWDVLSAHLDEIGARRIVAHSRADADAKAFVGRCGFGLAGTITGLAVDPRSVASLARVPPGIEIATLGAFADDPERVFVADYESFLDEPGPGDASGMTYESWRRLTWDNPECDRELSSVAVAAGVPVGVSFLDSDRATGRAVNVGTGVTPAFRGQSLGLLMKQRSLAAAAEAGIVRVITQNDETNAPMMAINERLGYRPFSSGCSWVLER
ncbi:GNAT family N-acetyltransferase [Gaiella sp.]|uniref:GNAT family N-acetyltransferase n=1 Tax=Gaiella sp. TaxID=2663207 RepID=UPI00398310E6